MIDIIENKCDFCGTCISVCPPDCIEVSESNISIDDEKLEFSSKIDDFQ